MDILEKTLKFIWSSALIQRMLNKKYELSVPKGWKIYIEYKALMDVFGLENDHHTKHSLHRVHPTGR
jgi:hypothetical protein